MLIMPKQLQRLLNSNSSTFYLLHFVQLSWYHLHRH